MATELLAVLLGAGGAGGLAGLINVYLAARKGKLESDESLIRRLDDDSRRQGQRADEAQRIADLRTRQRNAAWEQAASFRRLLLASGADHVPPLVEFRDD